MSLFSRSKKPPWLDTAREFCRACNITIIGWGCTLSWSKPNPRNVLLKFLANSPILAFNASPTQTIAMLAS